MLNENKKLLDTEIGNILKELKNTKMGTDEYAALTANLNSLYRLGLEQEKVDNGFETEMAKIKSQAETESKRVKTENKNEIMKVCVAVGSLLFNGALKAVMYYAGLRFEESGSVGSPFVKNLISIDPMKN